MYQKAMITDHERTELTSRLTSLDRGNKLTEIMMQKYSVRWLVKFCQCLLESYARERSLDIHYTLFQQIKGTGMRIVASLLQLTLEKGIFCLNVHTYNTSKTWTNADCSVCGCELLQAVVKLHTQHNCFNFFLTVHALLMDVPLQQEPGN